MASAASGLPPGLVRRGITWFRRLVSGLLQVSKLTNLLTPCRHSAPKPTSLRRRIEERLVRTRLQRQSTELLRPRTQRRDQRLQLRASGASLPIQHRCRSCHPSKALHQHGTTGTFSPHHPFCNRLVLGHTRSKMTSPANETVFHGRLPPTCPSQRPSVSAAQLVTLSETVWLVPPSQVRGSARPVLKALRLPLRSRVAPARAKAVERVIGSPSM